MNLFENLQLMKEWSGREVNKSKKIVKESVEEGSPLDCAQKIESVSNNELWDKINKVYKGFVPIKDLTNFMNLNTFGDFVEWCKREAGEDYDYNKVYSDWDEAIKELNDLLSINGELESVSMENIFNYFSNGELEDYYEWMINEYDLADEEDEELDESVKKEAINLDKAIFRYTAKDGSTIAEANGDPDLESLRDYDGETVKITDITRFGPGAYAYDIEFSDGEQITALSGEHLDLITNESVKKEAVYNPNVTTKDEIYAEFEKLNSFDINHLTLGDLCNCYSSNDLRDLYDYLTSEYDIMDEYDSNISTTDDFYEAFDHFAEDLDVFISLDDLMNCFSFDKVREFYDYVSSEYFEFYDDEELDEAKKLKETIIDDDKDPEDLTIKEPYVHTGNTVDEIVNDIIKTTGEELKYNDLDFITQIVELYMDDKRFTQNDIDEAIKKVANHYHVTEATSGIGGEGSYTKKALDMLPEDIKSEYSKKIDDEKSAVELVKLIHTIRDNKGVSSTDRKELEDKIISKVKSIKTESANEVYGDISDEEIQKKIKVYKDDPNVISSYADESDYAWPVTFMGKEYWIIKDGGQAVIDENQYEMFLAVDNDMKKYNIFFEIEYEDDGDGESGSHLTSSISSTPFKVIEL